MIFGASLSTDRFALVVRANASVLGAGSAAPMRETRPARMEIPHSRGIAIEMERKLRFAGAMVRG
jgi:hypothetical protein